MISANTILEAEAKASKHPSMHGFANSYDVTVYARPDYGYLTPAEAAQAKVAVQAALAGAGYVWCAERKRFERGQFYATARVSKMSGCVIVHCGDGAEALATGEAGYLTTADRPTVD